MFIGHYSVSLALKKEGQSIPLWKLFLAVQFLDIIWSIFIFLGIEKAKIDLHTLAGSPLNLYYMPFTHSVWGALFWSVVVFLIFSKEKKKASILALAVFSHWILDLIAHSADLPLWGNSYKVGFGLYHSAIGTFALEVILLLIGAVIYLRTQQLRKTPIVVFILFLVLLCWNSVWGPKPPTANFSAGFLLFFYFFLAAIIYLVEKKFSVPK